MLARARVNWIILKTCLEERFVYRADFIFATLVRFLPIVTQIFLWRAIYPSPPSTTINSYTYKDMVAYYLLAMIGRAFSSMPGLASGISRDVRDGTIKKYLTQPIDMLGYLFWHRVAHKLVYYFVATGPFVLVFYLCRDFFPGWPERPLTVVAFVASLVMGFLTGFLIEALIGLISFWFLEVSSLLFIYMMFNYFLSGHMIPLDWLGEFGNWVEFLPFKYLAYVPAAIMLEKDGYRLGEGLETQLAIQAIWIVALLVLNRLAFQRGVRRYGAFGG